MDWTPRYEYLADVVDVIDGDTVALSVDVGLDADRRIRCRLYGINAPERRGDSAAAGEAAKEHLAYLIHVHALARTPAARLVVRTHKDRTEKYGRYLVELIGDDNGQPINLNDRMLRDGHAVVAPWR